MKNFSRSIISIYLLFDLIEITKEIVLLSNNENNNNENEILELKDIIHFCRESCYRLFTEALAVGFDSILLVMSPWTATHINPIVSDCNLFYLLIYSFGFNRILPLN